MTTSPDLTPEAVTEYARRSGLNLRELFTALEDGDGDRSAERDIKAMVRTLTGHKRVTQTLFEEAVRVIDEAIGPDDEPTPPPFSDPPTAAPVVTVVPKSLKGTMAQYRARYGREASCGDEIATKLKGADLEKVAERNDIDFSRWGHLNPGQQRMCFGNVLRARVKRGEKIVL
jgi:hypothetical protein